MPTSDPCTLTTAVNKWGIFLVLFFNFNSRTWKGMCRDSLISFPKLIEDLSTYQVKPWLILSMPGSLGTCQEPCCCTSSPAMTSPLVHGVHTMPELAVRSPQHQAESGTNNLKESTATTNIAPTAKHTPGRSAGTTGHLCCKSLSFMGLWLIIKGQQSEALFISAT